MNRADRKAVAVCAILLLGCLILIVCGITAHVQRRSAQSRMVEHTATVTDLVANRSGKTTTWDAYITYVVNGVEYTRELGNDTTVAVSADGKRLEIGDTVTIYYNPANPRQIVTDQTNLSEILLIVFGSVGLAFVTLLLILILKPKKINSRQG